MDFYTARLERRELKQKLFQIRRYMEGENIILTAELKRVKALYEKLHNFTDWCDFPEKWDIGDPHSVKAGAYASSDEDKDFLNRKLGQSYETIIHLTNDVKDNQ